MKLSLTFGERLAFAGVIPQKGNLIDMQIGHGIMDRVKPTESEMKAAGLKRTPDGWYFDTKAVPESEIDFSEAETTLLRSQVRDLDAKKSITHEILTVCEKISKAQ